jgi:hypothetical protein
MRYRGTGWGNSTIALVNEGLTGKQVTRMDRYNPSTGQLEKLMERNTTDNYSSPARQLLKKTNLAMM